MVDVNAQMQAVERGVESTERHGQAVRVQRLAQEYPTTIADVWNAVATERIGRWFLPITGDLRLGGRYQLEGNAGGVVRDCRPPSDGVASYHASWEFGGNVTWITVRLTETGDRRTRLELEHVAPTADVPDDMWERFGPSATGIGWDSGLLGLAGRTRSPRSCWPARPSSPLPRPGGPRPRWRSPPTSPACSPWSSAGRRRQGG